MSCKAADAAKAASEPCRQMKELAPFLNGNIPMGILFPEIASRAGECWRAASCHSVPGAFQALRYALCKAGSTGQKGNQGTEHAASDTAGNKASGLAVQHLNYTFPLKSEPPETHPYSARQPELFFAQNRKELH